MQDWKILEYWHLVEFFSTYDLDSALELPDHYQRKLTHEELCMERADETLPWLYKPAIAKMGANPHKTYAYTLYFLPFEKSELTRLSEQVLAPEKSMLDQIEYQEKLDDEGRTCFAKLSVSQTGWLSLDRVSISTLPWAMGKLKTQQLQALSVQSYRHDEIVLYKTLEEILARFDGRLTAKSMQALIDAFNAWAQIEVSYPIAVIVDMYEVRSSERDQREELAEEEELDEQNIPILNSFYIEDLEKIIRSSGQEPNELLSRYIFGGNIADRMDLYQATTEPFIREMLKPEYMNKGRWPHACSFSMSLMQQFGLNEMFHPTMAQTLLSVNGPPGTGKTTLFQDIFANNIVRRAEVLSTFAKVSDTFVSSRNIAAAKKNIPIHELHPRLTGYEMLVVSSNNTAVENITKDIPLTRKLGNEFKGKFDYLGPVSRLYTTKWKPEKEESVWGMISVALGKLSNCKQFASRVFFYQDADQDTKKSRLEKGDYLTLWEWAKKYTGPRFFEAKKIFAQAKKEVDHYVKKIESLAEMIDAMRQSSHQEAIRACELELKHIEHLLSEHQQQYACVLEALQQQEKMKCYYQTQRQEIISLKPPLLDHVFNRKKMKDYHDQLSTNTTAIYEAMRHLDELQKTLLQYREEQTSLKTKKEMVLKEKKAIEDECLRFEKHYQTLLASLPGIVLPPLTDLMDDAAAQVTACWQSEHLNRLRTELFIAALNVHQAWLVEALKTKPFIDNCLALSQLFSGSLRVREAKDMACLWQNLFMIVPVVSSTFASIQRLLGCMGQNTLGWLLIDEAGQTIPQAAVGAIWRSKKVVVVGDPRQIEPVYTTAPSLVERLAKHSLQTDYHAWLPTQVSVQALADQANRWGVSANIGGRTDWLGCPLNIHRRCLEPMFSVANHIAYEDRMINARNIDATSSHYPLGQSCWIDIVSPATDHQYVEAQGKLFLRLFLIYFFHYKTLPDLYVIAPFKRIKFHLQKIITDFTWMDKVRQGDTMPTKSDLKRWCKAHIGTVHSFQGKESGEVIFVLGADRAKQGSVSWACSRPNLLNVALTRARDRIYIVGDYELWGRQRYFSSLSSVIPRVAHDSVGYINAGSASLMA